LVNSGQQDVIGRILGGGAKVNGDVNFFKVVGGLQVGAGPNSICNTGSGTVGTCDSDGPETALSFEEDVSRNNRSCGGVNCKRGLETKTSQQGGSSVKLLENGEDLIRVLVVLLVAIGNTGSVVRGIGSTVDKVKSSGKPGENLEGHSKSGVGRRI